MDKTTFKRYGTGEVLDMLEDIPSDFNDNTSEESSESENELDDVDYCPPEIEDIVEHEDGLVEMADIAPTESNEKDCATSEKENTKSTGKSKRTKDASKVQDSEIETIVAQVEYLESYISEIGSSQLTPEQIKYLQATLPQLDKGKTKEKLTQQRIKSLVEIAQRGWKKLDQPTKIGNFEQPEGINPKQKLFMDLFFPNNL